MELVRILIFAGFYFICTNGNPHYQNFQLGIGESCVLKDGSEGICQLDKSCKSLIELLKITKNELEDIVICGYKGKQSIVCCKHLELAAKISSSSFNFRRDVLCEGKTETIPKRQQLRLDDHIVNGEKAEVAEFPHMAAIGYQTLNQGIEFDCGGSLISSRFVLTAAHCVHRKDPLPKMTSLKTDLDSEDGQDIEIEDIIIHKNFRYQKKTNDIALLKLKNDVVFTHNVWPICLSSKQIEKTTEMTVIGFGVLNFDEKIQAEWLMKGSVNEYPQDKCTEYFKTYLNETVEDTQVCFDSSTSFTDACQGDSGGPLEYQLDKQHFLYGIVSYGNACHGHVPSIYTRVDKFLDWIEENMKNS